VGDLARIKKALSEMSLTILVENDREFVDRTMVLPTKDQETEIRIDFTFSFSPYEKQALKKARDIKIGKTQVKFASLENVVIHKVISGRPRDWEDIKSILVKNPRYDSDYISRWLKEFDLSLKQNFLEAFKKARKEIKKLESKSQ
jgi:predicted nucleotidyltransferase